MPQKTRRINLEPGKITLLRKSLNFPKKKSKKDWPF